MIFAIGCVALVVGCDTSQRPDGFPPVFACKIELRNDGSPISGAEISLTPSDRRPYYAIYGHTNSSGTAIPVTVEGVYSQKGVPEGEYIVTVRKKPELDYGKTPEEVRTMSFEEFDAYNDDYAKRLAQMSRIVPASLSDPTASPLRMRIDGKTPASLAVDIAQYDP